MEQISFPLKQASFQMNLQRECVSDKYGAGYLEKLWGIIAKMLFSEIAFPNRNYTEQVELPETFKYYL